jgi:outer membrane lipoprotein LolB
MRSREMIMHLYQPFKIAPILKKWCHHRLQNHKATRFFMLSCLLLLLTSCTTIGNNNDSSNLNGINPFKSPPSSWQINAKLGIRSPQKNGSVTLNWQQTAGNFTIKVQGPLGQGNAVISGTQYNAEIKQPGKPTVQSNNVDTLVFDTFGWTLPFDNFMHWVVATANPQKVIGDISYDPRFGTLSTLEQSGWALDYSRYKPVDTWALPGRISATHIDTSNKDEAQTKLTLIIRKWTIL